MGGKRIDVDKIALKDLYLIKGLSTTQIGALWGFSSTFIYDKLIKAGVAVRSKSEAVKLACKQGRINKWGEFSPHWKGGRRIVRGYVYLLKRGHPYADKNGYVKEHVLVLEQKLGHPLKANEIPHHLNGIRSDNRPENLIALPKKGEKGHHGYLVMQAQQERIRELEGVLNACPRF